MSFFIFLQFQFFSFFSLFLCHFTGSGRDTKCAFEFPLFAFTFARRVQRRVKCFSSRAVFAGQHCLFGNGVVVSATATKTVRAFLSGLGGLRG